VAAATVVAAKNHDGQDPSRTFLNVSYDPTRELYRDLNRVLAAEYAESTGTKVEISQSHGGSSRQSRAVMGGLPADVVTLALHSDVDALRKHGLIAEGWERRLPRSTTRPAP
jgi:sulfate transport system substrate-binding protein